MWNAIRKTVWGPPLAGACILVGTFLDKVRELKQDLESEVKKGQFIKEVEPFMLNEAMTMLTRVEEYLNGYLQVDKFRGG